MTPAWLAVIAERERKRLAGIVDEAPPSPFVSVETAAHARPVRRLRTRIDWLDYMLGGGFVCGAVVMVHGEPGAGKSTMLAQAAGHVRGAAYISAEEELSQVAARFARLGLRCDLAASDDIQGSLEAAGRAQLVIVDSVQAMSVGALVATQLAVDHARAMRVAVAIVCHQNKGGGHSGPRTIEHLIDATVKVGRGPPRSITTEKNRYGEAGISLFLKMTESGLELMR